MSYDLFFINLFMKAFDSAQPEEALKEAFAQIDLLGSQPSYRHGFLQFEAFLREVYSRHALWRDEHIRELIVELATGMLHDDLSKRQAALETICRHPDWQADYQSLCEMLEPGLSQNDLTVLTVYNDRRCVATIHLSGIPICKTFAGIEPGLYGIRLETGLVIWDGRLSAQDLIWTAAFGRQGLSVAAETEEVKPKPTWQQFLLEGELILRTYAGIEKGSLEIELTRGVC